MPVFPCAFALALLPWFSLFGKVPLPQFSDLESFTLATSLKWCIDWVLTANVILVPAHAESELPLV